MGRRGGSSSAGGIQLLPFLDILTCTMGALVTLLFAFARYGQEQVVKVSDAKQVEAEANAAAEVEDLQWRASMLRESRDKTESDLGHARLELSHLEDHLRRLRERADQIHRAAIALENADPQASQAQTGAELDKLKERIALSKRELELAKQNAAGKPTTYSIVPYAGPNQTRRRPIYLECRAEGVVLEPEGIVFTDADFGGPLGPGNPLAAAVRAAREYMQENDPNAFEQVEPYPLLVVRPDAIPQYYAARSALISFGSQFGYELIGADKQLKFPDPDPRLAERINVVIAEARVRQEQLIAAAPKRYRKPKSYHVKPGGGGIEQDGDPRVAQDDRNPYRGLNNRGPGGGRGTWGTGKGSGGVGGNGDGGNGTTTGTTTGTTVGTTTGTTGGNGNGGVYGGGGTGLAGGTGAGGIGGNGNGGGNPLGNPAGGGGSDAYGTGAGGPGGYGGASGQGGNGTGASGQIAYGAGPAGPGGYGNGGGPNDVGSTGGAPGGNVPGGNVPGGNVPGGGAGGGVYGQQGGAGGGGSNGLAPPAGTRGPNRAGGVPGANLSALASNGGAAGGPSGDGGNGGPGGSGSGQTGAGDSDDTPGGVGQGDTDGNGGDGTSGNSPGSPGQVGSGGGGSSGGRLAMGGQTQPGSNDAPGGTAPGRGTPQTTTLQGTGGATAGNTNGTGSGTGPGGGGLGGAGGKAIGNSADLMPNGPPQKPSNGGPAVPNTRAMQVTNANAWSVGGGADNTGPSSNSTPGSTTSGGSGASGGSSNNASSGSSGGSSNTSANSGGMNSGSSSQGGQQSGLGMPNLNFGQQPQNPQQTGKHGKRGGGQRPPGWGLPDAPETSTSVSRPVVIECWSDKLAIIGDDGKSISKQIPLNQHTEDAIDELVSSVLQHTKQWGAAGKGLYWKPTLSMRVAPEGRARFAELQTLLADSGLDVKESTHKPSIAGKPAKPVRR